MTDAYTLFSHSGHTGGRASEGNDNTKGWILGTGFSSQKKIFAILTQIHWDWWLSLKKVRMGHKAPAVTRWMGHWRSVSVFWVLCDPPRFLWDSREAKVVRTVKGLRTYPTCKPISYLITVSWMLAEDILLSQMKNSLLLTAIQVVRVSPILPWLPEPQCLQGGMGKSADTDTCNGLHYRRRTLSIENINNFCLKDDVRTQQDSAWNTLPGIE